MPTLHRKLQSLKSSKLLRQRNFSIWNPPRWHGFLVNFIKFGCLIRLFAPQKWLLGRRAFGVAFTQRAQDCTFCSSPRLKPSFFRYSLLSTRSLEGQKLRFSQFLNQYKDNYRLKISFYVDSDCKTAILIDNLVVLLLKISDKTSLSYPGPMYGKFPIHKPSQAKPITSMTKPCGLY